MKTEFRCFNNHKIEVTGLIQVDITSGSSNAKNCTILLVNKNTINIMHYGKRRHGPTGPTPNNFNAKQKSAKKLLNVSNTHQRISKRIFTKYPQLCTRLGRSKNHGTNPTFKNDFQPTQHKGQRIPLHLTEKVERELKKLIDEKHFWRTFHEPCSHYS